MLARQQSTTTSASTSNKGGGHHHQHQRRGIRVHSEKTEEEVEEEFERRLAKDVAAALLAAVPHTAESGCQTTISLGAFENFDFNTTGNTADGDSANTPSVQSREKRKTDGKSTQIQSKVSFGGVESDEPEVKRLRTDGDETTSTESVGGKLIRSHLEADDEDASGDGHAGDNGEGGMGVVVEADADDISVLSEGNDNASANMGGSVGRGIRRISNKPSSSYYDSLDASMMAKNKALMDKLAQFITIKLTPDGPRYCMPPGFGLVLIEDDAVELCPGIRLASASRHPRTLEIPPGILYCVRDADAPLDNGMKRVPFYMRSMPKVTANLYDEVRHIYMLEPSMCNFLSSCYFFDLVPKCSQRIHIINY
jgi:hypothetical protein